MTAKTSKYLVIIGGLGWRTSAFSKLLQSAPPNWYVLPVTLPELLPKVDLDQGVDNLHQILNKITSPNIYLAAHSTGGLIALRYAAKYPEAIKQLILIDSEGVYDHKSIPAVYKDMFLMHLQSQGKNLPIHTRNVFEMSLKPIYFIKLAQIAHFTDLENTAQTITVPTLLIWGEKDLLIPPTQGKKLQQTIPNAKLHIIKQVAHDWLISAPEMLWRLLP